MRHDRKINDSLRHRLRASCPVLCTKSLEDKVCDRLPGPLHIWLILCSVPRYALNFKHVHCSLQYETSWVELPNVAEVRKGLGAIPNRKHDIDGGDFYTLPVIVDHSTGQTVGDSFDIAAYLDRTYPSQPVLFQDSTVALHRAFNTLVDKVFTDHVLLAVYQLPFNTETADISRAEFCRRAEKKSWDEFRLDGENRATMLGNFETALGGLAKVYTRRDEGPFLEGRVPMYADLIIG